MHMDSALVSRLEFGKSIISAVALKSLLIKEK